MTARRESRSENPEVVPQSLGAGLAAGIYVASAVGVVTTLVSPIFLSCRLFHWFATFVCGLELDKRTDSSDFLANFAVGLLLGFGLFTAGATLNWMVEQVDVIVGDKADPAKEATG